MIGRAFVLAICAVVFVGAPAQAETINIDWVTVGDPGNADDGIGGYGGVGYTYWIGKYEVSNTEYTAFLNAVAATDTYGLYHTGMGSDARGGITRSGSSGSYGYSVKTDMGNKPVSFVSFYDSLRFCNWLHNGQPTGAQNLTTTEDGAYLMSLGASVVRKPGALVFLPSEDEWYKAAYYKGGGTSAGYWDYPTQSDSTPTVATANSVGDIFNPGANVVNYNDGADWNGQVGNVTTVGSAGLLSASYYGTFDQGGNLWEWNEALLGYYRGARGGAFFNDANWLRASGRNSAHPAAEYYTLGFRVASVPEPSTAVLIISGLVCGLWLWRRRLG